MTTNNPEDELITVGLRMKRKHVKLIDSLAEKQRRTRSNYIIYHLYKQLKEEGVRLTE